MKRNAWITSFLRITMDNLKTISLTIWRHEANVHGKTAKWVLSDMASASCFQSVWSLFWEMQSYSAIAKRPSFLTIHWKSLFTKSFTKARHDGSRLMAFCAWGRRSLFVFWLIWRCQKWTYVIMNCLLLFCCPPHCLLAEFLTTLFKIETLYKDYPISPIDAHQILCNYL